MFKARHSRGALDPAPVTSWEVASTPFGGITPPPFSTGMIVNPRTEVRSTNGSLYPNPKMGHQVVSPSSGHIIGEGATIFMDMTETMLDALDQQMVLSAEAQKPEGSLTDNVGQTRSQMMSDTKDSYPDLYLSIVENYKIGDKFYGYLDSLSTDNNPMVLVEMKGLSYQYGMSIYAVDRVNGTMYSKFDVDYRMISEKATVKPQFRPTSLEDEYTVMQPTYVNTLPGTTSVDTPIAKSTPVTQASQIPSMLIVLPHMRDILETSSSKQVRAAYLDRQMQNMNSVRVPSSMPSLEDGTSIEPESVSRRIHDYCQERRDNRKHEWETHKMTLNSIKEKKEKQYQQ